MQAVDTIIIGGGLTGLATALHLHRGEREFLLVEKDTFLGGRMHSLQVDGYTIDTGFQISLSSYPELRALCDPFSDLGARAFASGARVLVPTSHQPRHQPLDLYNPLLHPTKAWNTVSSMRHLRVRPTDIMGVMRLIAEAVIYPASALPKSGPTQSVEGHLLRIFHNSPFYTSVIAPFLEGVLLRELTDQTDAREDQGEEILRASPASVLHNLLPYFIFGKALLFNGGAAALPRFLSGSLPKESVRLGACCRKIEMTNEGASTPDSYRVTIQEGRSSYVVTARRVVVACTLPTILPLLETLLTPTESLGGLSSHQLSLRQLPPYNRTSHTYYLASDTPPYSEPLLVLNGGQQGVVNHVAVLTNVQPSYAPPGKHLIAVCTRRAASFDEIISECYQLFAQLFRGADGGADGGVDGGVNSAQKSPNASLSLAPKLTPVAERIVKNSLPEFPLVPSKAGFIRHLGVYLAGDATTYGSQNGALLAGRRVAESILSES